jgi:hypothetical protein
MPFKETILVVVGLLAISFTFFFILSKQSMKNESKPIVVKRCSWLHISKEDEEDTDKLMEDADQ